MTREEFLLDTIKYYSEDVNRRCESELGGCYYSPVRAGNSKSNGCAIGRWLEPELQEQLDLRPDSGAGRNEVFEKFPEWMKVLGQYFLQEVQMLHDNSNYWYHEGLTDNGKKRVEKIINNFNLDKKQFKEYLN